MESRGPRGGALAKVKADGALGVRRGRGGARLICRGPLAARGGAGLPGRAQGRPQGVSV